MTVRTNPIDALDAMTVYLYTFWADAPALSWVLVLATLVAGVALWHTDEGTGAEWDGNDHE